VCWCTGYTVAIWRRLHLTLAMYRTLAFKLRTYTTEFCAELNGDGHLEHHALYSIATKFIENLSLAHLYVAMAHLPTTPSTCIPYYHYVALWRGCKAMDLRSVGRGFNSQRDKAAWQPSTSCSLLCASVAKQYNLVLVEGR